MHSSWIIVTNQMSYRYRVSALKLEGCIYFWAGLTMCSFLWFAKCFVIHYQGVMPTMVMFRKLSSIKLKRGSELVMYLLSTSKDKDWNWRRSICLVILNLHEDIQKPTGAASTNLHLQAKGNGLLFHWNNTSLMNNIWNCHTKYWLCCHIYHVLNIYFYNVFLW